jgi:hypothetical protein
VAGAGAGACAGAAAGAIAGAVAAVGSIAALAGFARIGAIVARARPHHAQ